MPSTFDRIPPWAILLVSLMLVGLIGVIDYLTGYEVSFSIFYIIPILIAALRLGFPAGLLMAVFSSVAWFTAEKLGGRAYSYPLIPFWNAIVRFGFFLIAVYAASVLKRLRELDKSVSRVDFLTQLANSRAVYEFCDNELKRAKRSGLPISVAYIDGDNFKEVNDRHGHQRGDQVLVTAAAIIKENVRATDLGARMGGDEFLIVLPETGDKEALLAITRLRDKMEAAMQQNHLPMSFSIGLVTYNTPPDSTEEMIHESDQVMYAVKKDGKNSIRAEVADSKSPSPAAGRSIRKNNQPIG